MTITIEEVKRLNAARTQGDWKEHQDGVHPYLLDGIKRNQDYAICAQCFGPDQVANRSFIAAAPAIAQLAIDLHKENTRLVDALQQVANWSGSFEDAKEFIDRCALWRK